MLAFIIRRILYLIPLLFGISLFAFGVLRFNENDAVISYLTASSITPSEANIKQAKIDLGLDKPITKQYIIWIKKAILLDFGKSYLTKRDVFDDMLYHLPATLKLAGFALLITLVISIPLGMASAIYKDSFIDYFTRIFSFLGVSTPNFWLGLLLILLFSVKLELLPPFGSGGFSHIIMPAMAISFMPIAVNARFLRTNMLEIKNQRFIYYAKLRGISSQNINLKHIFLNSLIPIITIIGMYVGELIGGALIVENIFAYPGIGRYAVTAILNNDYPIIQCFIIMLSFIFIILNLCIDIIYALIDPRIRLGMENK